VEHEIPLEAWAVSWWSKDTEPGKLAESGWELTTHFSASSHLEGKLFLERLGTLLKPKMGLPGVEGACSLLCVVELLPSPTWAETSLLSELPLFGIGKELSGGVCGVGGSITIQIDAMLYIKILLVGLNSIT